MDATAENAVAYSLDKEKERLKSMDDIKKLKSCLLTYLLEVATDTDKNRKRCCPVCGSGTGKNSN